MNHAQTNLNRLVHRLSQASSTFPVTHESPHLLGFQIQSMLSTVKYARKLLRDVELQSISDEDEKVVEQTRDELDKVQAAFEDVLKDHPVIISRPTESLLSRIPAPPVGAVQEKEEEAAANDIPLPLQEANMEAALLPSEEPVLLPSSSTSWAISPTPAAPAPTSAPRAPAATGAAATHEQLSNQLAQMASQLRHNAEHFSRALEDDKAVLERAEEKLDTNLDSMTSQKGRLKEYSSKTAGRTCGMIGMILMVLAIFVLSVAIIRATRR